MFHFRTLTQRFGALYALVVALLLGVSVVVTLHMQNIRIDSERLIEEARELTIAARLITEIDLLSALLQQPVGLDLAELERGRALLGATRLQLLQLEGPEQDPSREEHGRAEARISERLAEDLESADRMLDQAASTTTMARARELLAAAKHYAQVLQAEARREALESNSDLQARARQTRLILILTWIAAILLLGVGLRLIHKGVVRPLRELADGAERFGQGERTHRIQISDTDELGDLATSFNAMADRLESSQENLEQRVRQRTREFLRAARLADLGILASGIAHEINTPLASIASSAEGLQRRAQQGTLQPELLEEYSRVISDETYRAREITTRMLALVRQEPTEIATVPLRIIVEQAVGALRHRAEQRSIQLEAAPVPDDLHVVVNAGELVQILVNLLANAIDASPAGALVELRLRHRESGLQIEVADRGCGIPEEDLEHVFEPFFTTKGPGEGTGLGLALVATMVGFRGGRISVHSDVGEGTVFTVVLPTDWSASE